MLVNCVIPRARVHFSVCTDKACFSTQVCTQNEQGYLCRSNRALTLSPTRKRTIVSLYNLFSYSNDVFLFTELVSIRFHLSLFLVQLCIVTPADAQDRSPYPFCYPASLSFIRRLLFVGSLSLPNVGILVGRWLGVRTLIGIRFFEFSLVSFLFVN